MLSMIWRSQGGYLVTGALLLLLLPSNRLLGNVSGCGGLIFESYNTGGGTNIIDLTSHPSFPNSPRERLQMASFNTREVYPDDSHDGYGARIRGLFIPPVTTNWIFYLRSDHASQLYLSPDNTAANKILIAAETACCNPFTSHFSNPIPLQAGAGYYIEVLYTETVGNDYAQVAVKPASDPANPNTLPPIPGSYLGWPVAPAGIGGPINLTQQPVNITVNEDTPATFTVGAINPNGLPLCYQWSRGAPGGPFADIPGATESIYTLLASRVDDGAAFHCTVGVVGSNAVTAEAILTVLSSPIIVQQPQNRTVSVGASAMFCVMATGTAPLTYQWRFNGMPIPGATTSCYLVPSVSPANVGTYSVVVANIVTNVVSSSATLALDPPCENIPPAVTSVDPDCAGNRVVITFSEPMDITAADPANYAISPGVVVISASLNAPGTKVTLTVAGLTSSITNMLSIANVRDQCANVLLPNPYLETFTCEPADLTGSWPMSLNQTCAYKANLQPYIILKSPFTVSNAGPGMAKASVVKFFLSDDDVLDADDPLIQKQMCRKLGTNQVRQIQFRGKLPVCTPATNKFVIAVVNATQRVPETDTNNNQTIFGPIP